MTVDIVRLLCTTVFALAISVGILLIAVMTLLQLPEQRRIENPCVCKSEIKGKQLYASLCQSSSIKGPVEQECLYR